MVHSYETLNITLPVYLQWCQECVYNSIASYSNTSCYKQSVSHDDRESHIGSI